MTILINIDDFLFQLFPDTKKDITQIKEKLIEFYTIDDVKPEVKIESDVIKIKVANNNFSGNDPIYKSLISKIKNGI